MRIKFNGRKDAANVFKQELSKRFDNVMYSEPEFFSFASSHDVVTISADISGDFIPFDIFNNNVFRGAEISWQNSKYIFRSPKGSTKVNCTLIQKEPARKIKKSENRMSVSNSFIEIEEEDTELRPGETLEQWEERVYGK